MYAVRASCAVTDGKLDTYVASVEAPRSWQTRVDDDIAYLERESTERVAAAIGAFIVGIPNGALTTLVIRRFGEMMLSLLLIFLVIITYVPTISTFLPDLLMGKALS